MKTSKQWWQEIKVNKPKFDEWLKKQFFGESQAYKRITELAAKFDNPILVKIAEQEKTHAKWIENYCLSRGIDLEDLSHEERYWKEIELGFDTLEEAAAVGAHAEKMRLARIKEIAKDTTFDPELSLIFRKILKDEVFHERAFRELTTVELYESARKDHEKGAERIGLVL